MLAELLRFYVAMRFLLYRSRRCHTKNHHIVHTFALHSLGLVRRMQGSHKKRQEPERRDQYFESVSWQTAAGSCLLIARLSPGHFLCTLGDVVDKSASAPTEA